MLKNQHSSGQKFHPVISVVVIIVLAALGFVVGSVIPLYLYLPFFEGTETELLQQIQNFGENKTLQYLVYAMQASSTVCGLLLAPYLFARMQKVSLSDYFLVKSPDISPLIVTFLVVIIFMPVNSIFIEWNQNVHLPESLREIEQWARTYEDTLAEQTKALTKMDSLVDLVIGIVVIAILPGIGEEIVFRGLVQNELYRGTRNIHVSIWVAAFLFSAIHFQFFGFVPRLLLGALFGYLYYWSGNLTLAIIAHFVNNGVSVVAMYFYQQGALEYDLEATESAPANVVMISAVLTIGLLYYFYKYFEHRKPALPQL